MTPAQVRSWLKRGGPGTPGNRGGPKPPPRAALTFEQWAEQQAEKRIAAEVAAIEEQRRIFEEESRRAYERQLEQSRGLAEYIKGMGFDTRIRDIYSSAGQDIAGLAQGFAGQTRGIAAADAAEQMNMLSGTGQEGAVRNEGTRMGDVLYGVGGWIPGKSLGEQGAAYAADAALQPAFTLQQGAARAAQGLAEREDQALEFAKMLAETKSQKPTLKEEYLSERRGYALEQQKMNMDKLADERDYWLKLQALYISQGKLKLAKQAEARAQQAQNRYDMESAGLDYEGNVAPGHYRHPSGRILPNNYTINKKGEVVKIYAPDKPSGAKDKPKYTPGQADEIMQRVNSADTKKAVSETIASLITQEKNKPGKTSAKRKRIIAKLWTQYKHLAGGYGPAAKTLRKLIHDLVMELTKIGVEKSGPGGSKPGAGPTDAYAPPS